jgi:hypothetical protein
LSLSHLPQSNGAIERVNKTIKDKMFREMTRLDTEDWLSMIPKIQKNINSAKHDITGYIPEDLHKKDLAEDMKKKVIKGLEKSSARVYGSDNKNFKALKVGDDVRISLRALYTEVRADKFRKSGLPNWTVEIYKVAKIKKGNLQKYVRDKFIVSLDGVDLKRIFQRDSLLLVEKVDGKFAKPKLTEIQKAEDRKLVKQQAKLLNELVTTLKIK